MVDGVGCVLGKTVPPCGFLVLDKPEGLTSHDCVARVRRAYGLRRVGHGGTLDPSVTGVLPVALGPATRLLPYLPGDKTYRGVIQLGVRTHSDDLQGEVLARCSVPDLGEEDLKRALRSFQGRIRQVPPSVSAVHVAGQRAHERVRRGETVRLEARTVTVHDLTLESWDGATGRLALTVRCSAGTYIRSLARDLGDRLGCGGSLARLRRTAALGFGLGEAVQLERLAGGQPPALQDPLAALGHLPRHRLATDQLPAWQCGRPQPLTDEAAGGAAAEGEAVVVVSAAGTLAGMALRRGDWLLPKLVLDARG